MSNEEIGQCTCPLCNSAVLQSIRLSKSGKPYLTCDSCGMQLFARQANSIKHLKARAQAAQAQAAPVAAIPPKQPPAPPIKATPQDPPKEAAQAAVKPAPEASADLPTMFDVLFGKKQ